MSEHSKYEQIVKKAEDRIVETLAQNMELYGITHSVGHLYGTLIFQDKPMNLDEMGDALGMSKTSMSTGVRTLLDLKMVNKVWMKGTRKDHYEVEHDWYQTFIDYFSLKWRKATDANQMSLRKSSQELTNLLKQEDLPPDLREKAERDIERIVHYLAYYEWLERLIDSFESHEIFTFIPKNKQEAD
ncbi:GbsR/MarR family transcriptional regulator [Ammoniphilus sp. CFH 90114]|uniref:GbsR/MarR family transcriptional regulator n=1 Tax=Ammoniphilus sp. CFH 90114 TaxID=2493665 RepID=UPI00100E7CC9|nr:GbsR/MarR family transcriptional regulator [Ammoniphilus sp. CFH 90114]RXT15370.1 GbsR/MarR family transcriptional regulator [Ammoniphilus sp. CFH 90114]